MTVVWVGIDPGLTGAVAVLAADGTLQGLYDTATLAISKSKGVHYTYDIPGMVQILAPLACMGAHVTIEQSQPMPGQGVTSMFTTGLGYGLWLGVLTGLKLPYTPVPASMWKKALRLSKDKEQCRARAIQLFPEADLRRKRDHGRSEALLIAHWSMQRGS